MKVKIKLECVLDVTDWYEGEGLTKRQELQRLNEDFNDIEMFQTHINREILEGNVKVDWIK